MIQNLKKRWQSDLTGLFVFRVLQCVIVLMKPRKSGYSCGDLFTIPATTLMYAPLTQHGILDTFPTGSRTQEKRRGQPPES